MTSKKKDVKKTPLNQLSRRERQIMDIIFKESRATAAEIHDRIPEPPSYSTVRALLSILERKGYIRHHADGPRYVYTPTMSQEKAKKKALQHLIQTFFNGSTEKVMAALLDISSSDLSEEEFDKLIEMINQAKKEDN
ncbi:BlaI/MecI/CopY family transcriptional regulator [Acidobacteriota bacterium]